MPVRMPRRKDLPPHWGLPAAILQLAAMLSFATVVIVFAPFSISPRWLAWPTAVGLIALGIALGLPCFSLTLAYLWPMLVGEAAERRRRAEGGDAPGDNVQMPQYLHKVWPPGSAGLRGSALWFLAAMAAMAGGTGIEFLLTGDIALWGAAISFTGFAIGCFIIPWLWLIRQFE